MKIRETQEHHMTEPNKRDASSLRFVVQRHTASRCSYTSPTSIETVDPSAVVGSTQHKRLTTKITD